MKAIIIPKTGGPEVLELQNVPTPEPGPNQVLIRVSFAGVNYVDVLMRRGGRYQQAMPFTPGYEVAGTVEAIGSEVKDLRIGQPVAALTVTGGYAEFAVASAVLTFPLDSESQIAADSAAASLMVGITAYDLLVNAARIREGDTVLVHGAAGGVGTAAGQIARAFKAGRVLGVVSSEQKATYAKPFGYDAVLSDPDFAAATMKATGGTGIDIALDASGEPTFSQTLALLKPFGRIVTFGNASNNPTKAVDSLELLQANHGVIGYSITTLIKTTPEIIAQTARPLLQLVASGAFEPAISDILPLEQAATAHERIEARSHMGKLLLRMR
jgi:NADPH2:quinone reductase